MNSTIFRCPLEPVPPFSRVIQPLAVAVLVTAVVVALSISTGCAGDLFVKLSGETITLFAEQAPLKKILVELKRQGVDISIDPSINPDITARYAEEPVERVVPSLLRAYNYSLLWQKIEGSSVPGLRLAGIQIFQQGSPEKMQPLQADGNLLIVQGDDGRLQVKNVVLAAFKTAVSEERLNEIAGSIGAVPTGSAHETGIVRLELPEALTPQQAAALLAGFEEIEGAEPDYAYVLEGNHKIVSSARHAEQEAEGVAQQSSVVAVLDSGLSREYWNSPFVSAFYDAFSTPEQSSDPLGHGTQMSLVAAGMVTPLGAEENRAQQNAVVSVRAFDDNGVTSNGALLRSIDYALAAEARILSMSWGSEESSLMLEKAIHYASDKGLILVAAAGNSPTGLPVYPAAYEEVIGVGALLPNGTVWEDSNRGDFVSVYAPGIAEMPVGHDGDPGIYAGTSISAAYIAHRIAAILQEQPGADTAALVTELNAAGN